MIEQLFYDPKEHPNRLWVDKISKKVDIWANYKVELIPKRAKGS